MGMSKKLSQASTKITKNNNDHKKQQLNNLIKVLRPKVYITDSASFKNLVQELTGNGNIIPIVSSSPPPPLLLDCLSNPSPVIEIEDDITDNIGYNLYQESSPEFSSFASSSDVSVPTNSFSTPSLEYYCSPEDLELGYHHSTTTFNEFGSSMENIDHFTQYRNIESWLLEMDTSNYEHGYVLLNVQPEASFVYDYELATGMIM